MGFCGLSCLRVGQRIKVHAIGRFAVKRGMWTPLIVKLEIAVQALPGVGDRVVGVQVNLLVFDAFPEPLDQHVVDPTTLTVHADLDAVLLDQVDKLCAGKLAALVRVEDPRCAMALDGLFDRFHAKIGRHAVGQSPGQHPPGCPVQDRRQVDEAFAHRDVGDVHGPDRVGPADVQAAQQVREDRMVRVLAAGVWMPVQRFDPHRPHQRRDMAATDLEARQAQEISKHPRARERVIEVQLVDLPHQRQIALGDRRWDRVNRRSGQVQQCALSHHRQWVRSINHRFALASLMRPSAAAKKSFSIAN